MRIRMLWAMIAILGTSVPVVGQVRVACIGDSITEGAGVDTPATNAWPVVLGRLLGPTHATRNFGVSGRTLLKRGDYPYWNEPAFRSATNYLPQVVVIKLGTNDSKPQNWRYKEQFAADLNAMVDVFANLPSRPRIWLCLPVPAYGIAFDINPGIIKNEIIPIIKQVARERGLGTIDLYTALSGRPELFPDNIHPNTAGAALIAKTVQGALLSQ